MQITLTLDLAELEARIMSALSDKIAELNAALDAALTRVQEDVAALQAKVAALQGQVDAGTATAADIAALEEAIARLHALDPTEPDVLPRPGA